jgi:hypothetical protein
MPPDDGVPSHFTCPSQVYYRQRVRGLVSEPKAKGVC